MSDEITEKTPLEPVEGEIRVISREERTFAATCEAAGNAVHVVFDLLYPVVVMSQKLIGHADGAKHDVYLNAVVLPDGGDEDAEMQHRMAIPRRLKTGRLHILATCEPAQSIEIELKCRIEHSNEQAKASDRMSASIKSLFRQDIENLKIKKVPSEPHGETVRTIVPGENPVVVNQDWPEDAKRGLAHVAPPARRVPSADIPEGVAAPGGVPMSMGEIPPDIQQRVTEQFAEMQEAGIKTYRHLELGKPVDSKGGES